MSANALRKRSVIVRMGARTGFGLVGIGYILLDSHAYGYGLRPNRTYGFGECTASA